jgi:flagellar assembly protein FliH
MTSSSPEAGAQVRIVPFAGRELRSGDWTRLGGSAVLGDAVTEHTLAGLAAEASAAARARGYATGWAEGRRAAAAELREATDALEARHRAEEQRREEEHRLAVGALTRAAAQLEDSIADVTARVESSAVGLAAAITEELVGHELAVAESPGLDAVRRALALVPGEPVTRIRVSTEDPITPGMTAVAGAAVVVADPSLRRGDAVVETAEAVVDARISGALDRVREVLLP